MLQLNYMVVSSKELTRSERIILASRGEDFGAILSDGVLKVNKDLKKPKKLEKLVRKLFEVDHLLDWRDDELMDYLYDEICTNWSQELWFQIRRAWGDTLHAKLEVEHRSEADEWLGQYGSLEYTDHLDDLMKDFRSGVMEAIYSKTKDIRDVFNYGFQMGARYGVTEATA